MEQKNEDNKKILDEELNKLKSSYKFIQYSGYLFVTLISLLLVIFFLAGEYALLILYSVMIFLLIKFTIKLPREIRRIIKEDSVNSTLFQEKNKIFKYAIFIFSFMLVARVMYMINEGTNPLLSFIVIFTIFYIYNASKTQSLPIKINKLLSNNEDSKA